MSMPQRLAGDRKHFLRDGQQKYAATFAWLEILAKI